MTTYINPLDLQTIFVNVFAGSWNIFIFLSIILVSALAGKFKFPDKLFMATLVLLGIILAPQLGGLYALMIVIVGLVIYYGFAKIVKT